MTDAERRDTLPKADVGIIGETCPVVVFQTSVQWG